jgi:hypothetical protein
LHSPGQVVFCVLAGHGRRPPLPAHGSFAQNRDLPPEDLECVSAAFELTLRYLHDHQSRYDPITARDYVAHLIMERAREGEHDAHNLWSAAIRALEEDPRHLVTRRADP